MNTTNSTSTGSIVVGVDGSTSSTEALTWAATEAGLQKRPLTIVHAEKPFSTSQRSWLESAGISTREMINETLADAQKIVDQARVKAAALCPDVEISTTVQAGDPRQVLLQMADVANMIVLGSRGRGPVASLLLGSVSVAVVRHAKCPVVITRPVGSEQEHRGVLVGSDGSARSLPTVDLAYREASLHHMPLTVVHCLWDPLVARVRWGHLQPADPHYEDAEQRIKTTLAGMSDKFPDVAMHMVLAQGAVEACLVDLSQQHDLLVVGRHAHSLAAHLGWGGLTTAIVEHGRGLVLVVP
jgi:nucleotide-binding universal stress UspA family protein